MKGERTDLMTVYIPSNHFQSRAKERLHIDITPELNQEITVRVQNGLYKGRKKSKKTAGVYIYERGLIFIWVYKDKRNIITKKEVTK